MKILVIGGNRFVGLRVSMALDHLPDTELHILNRTGQTAHVKNAVLHKGNRATLAGSFIDRQWDIVLDFAGFTAEHARESVHFFKAVKRYIFISSASVYGDDCPRDEMGFDPSSWKVKTEPSHQDQKNLFQFGKRQAEAVFTQEAHFPVVHVRFPFILGSDDYTRRLEFHFERIRDGQPIYMPNPMAKISTIHSEDAAKFLIWTLREKFCGSVNVASPEGLSLSHLLKMIEAATNRQSLMVNTESDENHSPYGVIQDSVLDIKKVLTLGYKPKSLMSWLPELIASLGGSEKTGNTRLH